MSDNIIIIKNYPSSASISLGSDYEAYLSALFSLRCLLPERQGVQFWIAQNIQDGAVGSFDDIVLCFQPQNEPHFAVCVQTKHVQGNRIGSNLTMQDFKPATNSKNDQFSIPKYYESVKLKNKQSFFQNVKKYSYILYTNRIVNSSVIEEDCEVVKQDDFSILFNTDTNGQIFQFKHFEYTKTVDKNVSEVKIHNAFIKSLYIFAAQSNVDALSKCIKETLKQLLCTEKVDKEMKLVVSNSKEKIRTFFSEWAKGFLGGIRILFKEEISCILSFYFLELFTIPYVSENLSELTVEELWVSLERQSILFDIFNKQEFIVVKKNDATDVEFAECRDFVMQAMNNVLNKYSQVIHTSVEGTENELQNTADLFIDDLELENIRQAYSALSKTSTIRDEQKLHYILWIYNKIPLVLELNNQTSLKQLNKLLIFGKPKKIVLFVNGNNPASDFEKQPNSLFTFSDLEEKLQNSILNNDMKLQGRQVQVRDVLFNESIRSEISTLNIIQIILGKFHIGGLNLPELPSTFVERSLQSVLVKTASLNVGNVINKFIVVCNNLQMFNEFFSDSGYYVNNIDDVQIQYFIDHFDEANIKLDTKVLVVSMKFLKQLSDALDKRNKRGIVYSTLQLTQLPEGGFTLSPIISTKETAFEQIVNVVALTGQRFLERKFIDYLNKHLIKHDEWDIYKHYPSHALIPFNCKYILTSNTNDFFVYQNLSYKSVGKISFRYFVIHEKMHKLVEWIPTFTHYDNYKKLIVKEEFDISSNVTSCYISDLNIISGGPGMGKSVLVDDLFRNGPCNLWIVPVNLNTESVKFKNIDALAISLSSDELLRKIIKFDNLTLLEKFIFNTYLNNHKVYVLMDGFDEVVHLYENKIIAFIRGLRKMNSKLLITTRPIQQTILEQRLTYFSRSINAFGVEEQKKYLTDFFQKNIEEGDKEVDYETKVSSFIDKILDATMNKMSAWDVSFAGIPLQTFMVATVYLKHCVDYLKTELFKAEEVDVISLYEKFINITIEHDEAKRKQITVSNYLDYRKILELSLNGYELCALKYIFGDNFKASDSVRNETFEFIENIKAGIENFGLVENVSEDGNPIFIHRTFAEFLVAKYMLKHYNESVDILSIILKDDVFDIIRNIMDRLLAGKSELHLLVLNKNVDEIKASLPKFKLNQTDLGNRSAIDVASSWGARHRIPEPDMLNNNHDNGFIFGTEDSKYSFYYHRANMGTEPILLLMLNSSKQLSFEPFILTSFSKILNFSIDCLALENTNILLEYVADKNIDVSESIEHLLNKFSSTSDNLKFRQLLYLCCMYDYSNIAKEVIKLHSETLILHDITFGPMNDDLYYVTGFYGSLKMLNLLLSSLNTNENEYVALRATATALRADNSDQLKEILISALHAVDGDEKTVLMYAAEWGCSSIVKKLIEMKVDLTAKNENGCTTAMLAAIRGRHDICSIFFREACRSNDQETINYLLGNFANATETIVNAVDESGKTPLIIAVQNKQTRIVQILLRAGANVNCADSNKNSPLIIATQLGLIDVVKALATYDAEKPSGSEQLSKARPKVLNVDINIMDSRGKTALLIATQNRNAQMLQVLLDLGANVNAMDSSRKTAVLIAVQNNDANALKILLGARPNVNAVDGSGNFALQIAVENRMQAIVKMLLDARANVNIAGKGGRTPLLIATENKDFELLEMLLDARANVNAADANGNTSLLLAAKAGETDIAGLLLEARADVTASDVNGDSPTLIVCKNGNSDILALLLRESVDINGADRFGSSPMIIATKHGHLEVVRLLVEAGADVNKADAKGCTALLIAADMGRTDIVETLLTGNPNVGAADVTGKTSLIIASQKGYTEIVKLLLDQDVNVNSSDGDGRSSLFFATDEGHIEIVRLLLDANADYIVADVCGETALERATRNGNTEIADLLRSYGAMQ